MIIEAHYEFCSLLIYFRGNYVAFETFMQLPFGIIRVALSELDCEFRATLTFVPAGGMIRTAWFIRLRSNGYGEKVINRKQDY